MTSLEDVSPSSSNKGLSESNLILLSQTCVLRISHWTKTLLFDDFSEFQHVSSNEFPQKYGRKTQNQSLPLLDLTSFFPGKVPWILDFHLFHPFLHGNSHGKFPWVRHSPRSWAAPHGAAPGSHCTSQPSGKSWPCSRRC